MAENVQCPVCTLYLHTGMNLSDHLETHPKEQVIRALVQMTISGNVVGNSNTNTLESGLASESCVANATRKLVDLEEKSLSVIKEDNLNVGSLSNSTSNQSVSSSQNSNNVLNFTDLRNERRNENDQEKIRTSIMPIKALDNTEKNNTAAIGRSNASPNENITQGVSKQTLNQMNSASNNAANAGHAYHLNSLDVATATNNIHSTCGIFGENTPYDQPHRNGTSNQSPLSTVPHMPPPPPPSASQSLHPGQHQEIAGRGMVQSSSNDTFHSVQSQHLLPPLPPHHPPSHLSNSSCGLRQTHLLTGQVQPATNSHHTQNLKVIYTPNLPPPPPLQLFTYQHQSHLQHHQKPPPAYGTAISQIRSQHNQSKHQVTGTLPTQHQQQTLQINSVLAQQQQQQQQHQQQHHMQQHQTLQHNLRIQVPPQQSPLPTPTKHLYSPKNSDLPKQSNSTASGHSQSPQHQQHSKTDLTQNQQLQQQQKHSKQQNDCENANISNSHIFNSNEILNKSSLKGTPPPTMQNQIANVPSYPQVSICPSTVSASTTAVAASTLGRHSNSPFAALLAAAAGAPSPNTSSVLRYAESPVAHYLERENGDFIVQETPKHIVECVETDNGEFSVIERIYQSPPSVLHIHDDGEDDDDDDNIREDRLVEEQGEHALKKPRELKVNDDESEKKQNKLDEKKNKYSSKDVKTKVSKRKTRSDGHSSLDNEIVDFVSISSDSEDEEEFISQGRKNHKIITEKIDLNSSSSTSTLLLPMQSLSTPSSISSTLENASDDGQQAISTMSTASHCSNISAANTNCTQHNSGEGTTNSSSSRKKSSKNTITVLSDVQLNLNEYLDLVGNIIASSKVAAQRKTFASIAPIPLVKIEKEEPMDEYILTNTTTSVSAPTLVNFEQLPPSKANKHETEKETDTPSNSYNKQTTENHNVNLTNKSEQDEHEEKKPQVFLSTPENDKSSVAVTINSSHVTSVIRMATTSQHQPQEPLTNSSEESNKCINEAEDLSQIPQKIQSMTNSKSLSHTPLVRKGPKKLVIKPKSKKTEIIPTEAASSKSYLNQEIPTTSAKARQDFTKPSAKEDPPNATDVKIKNEPINSITYDNLNQQSQYQPTTSFSILEQHLSSKEPILEFKEEKPCIQEASVPSTSIVKDMKIENNVNDDARVLYDFANSKKSQNEKPTIFPSSTSLFSDKKSSEETKFEKPQKQLSKNIGHENEATSSSSLSTYSSHSAMDSSIPLEEQNESSTASVSVATTSQTQHQTSQMYTDFHYNYLYNTGSNNLTPVTAEHANIKNHQQFSSFYQNTINNNNNNVTLLEDSSSSKQYTDYQQLQQNHHHLLQQQHQSAGTIHEQWFNNNNYQTSEPNVTPVTSNHSVSNINNSLSNDGNTSALDSNEASKYLDLDSCKREQNIDVIVSDRVAVPAPPPPSSSTSCSFNGTTENSMAGICSTAATLNIRTDEKMPAKGEISEQESNCDIDNSWSQPLYGDISARFFKTTFPGIFPQDNGWNQEEYFTVQDLSASTTAQATNSSNSRMKSFESSSSSGLSIFSQNSNDNCNIDVMPSTSAKIRKRRKRSSQDGKSSQTSTKRMQPTSTVTSQQMLMQHQNEVPPGVEFSFQHEEIQQQHHLQQQHLQQPSTSAAYLAGPSNASTAIANGFIMQQQACQQKQRTKVYECGHCNTKYSKLKDRNAHMVDVHNYVRQNRRLVCPTTGLMTTVNSSEMQDIALPTTSIAGGMLEPALQSTGCIGDSKQGIVKIENENVQGELVGVENIQANLTAKTEIMDDDKKSLTIVSLNSANTETSLQYDTKLQNNSLPLSLTTPTSKITTLYRMLVSFNMTTLKQNQSLSEFDENLIKSSIFFCYVCRKNFNSVKLYDAHLTEHPAECFTCGKKFQRWKNFSLHLKRHLGWKEFGCTVCDKKFVVRSALVEHMRMHSGLSPLKCKVCGKHFKRYSNLTQHRKRHTKQIVRRKEYVCYCGEVLPSKARFLWHKETHDSKPKCCPHCCDRFVHVNSLRRHIRLAHSDKFDYTEPMECPICKQIFAKASMKAHMATHSTETQYDCAICNKSFSTKWNLKIHSWVHANRTAKPFKCEHCPKAFVREVDFKNHMNSHKQIKPYTCEVCGCKFIRKYNYMRHRREHHGNKKYTCDLCKKSFHRHYYLIEHRRIHTGERPFQCSICGKSSTTKTNHNKHLKIHHSRDPFTVEV